MQKRAESLPGTVSASFPGPKEGGRDKEKPVAPEAEYLSSRCVLFTYYQGDISSVVDEHFSRALSSYIEGDGKRHATELGAGKSRATLPPSFWDSNYSPPVCQSHSEGTAYSVEPHSLHPACLLQTAQSPGLTHRARHTPTPAPCMNSTRPRAWSPTTAHCSCQPCARRIATLPGHYVTKLEPAPPGTDCCQPAMSPRRRF
ncbi:transcription cofactor vestigial-like protein 2, partial [Acipenser oxyrinchus oxyrinchus]